MSNKSNPDELKRFNEPGDEDETGTETSPPTTEGAETTDAPATDE